MSFSGSDYLNRLSKMQHSDYISGYMQLAEVLKTLTIHPQSFSISKQQFFDQAISQLKYDDVKYTRAPFAARRTGTCSMVQTCQVSWTITIPAAKLAIQINKTFDGNALTIEDLNKRVNFNGKEHNDDDPDDTMAQCDQGCFGRKVNGVERSEHLHFWLGFSTACGPFNQFAICKDSMKLWDTSIYARQQAVISSNSLSDLCANNSVSVSPLKSIIAGKRHCGVFIDDPLSDQDSRVITAPVTPYYYKIPHDITFSGVLDLNQLNSIFNSFPALRKNFASLYLQLWMQYFLQDLEVFMLAWKLATDDSFMRGYNSSKIGARTNIQVQLGMTPVNNICSDTAIIPVDLDQNNFSYFTSTRCYPDIKNVKLTPLTHYLCDGIVRIMFDDNPDPQVLSLEVIGEISGSAIRSG
ncbi:MAG: hypothetical protein EZS28_020137 [Streblomastix strix]|uniref:Uncharacterized protein n=1 Tax=Streblomastix strix TaxID=222440 RepID=A0A5J4VPC8_9EUKA|nr:MAG: hypothetical protein EZS28_020137 [Streblomastix strix]